MHIPFIGLRYLRSRLISILGVAGVAAGVGLILIVTSVMSGFAKEMRARIRGTTSHLSVTAGFGEFMDVWEPAFRRVLEIEEVKAATPRLEWMVLGEEGQEAAWIVGVDPELEAKTSELKEYVYGAFDFTLGGEAPDHPGVYVGVHRPFKKGDILPTGRPFTISSVRRKDGNKFLPVQMTLQTVGFYYSGLAEYDLSHLIVHLETAQDFLQKRGAVTRICLKVENWEDSETLERVRAKVFNALLRLDDGQRYNVLTWEDERRTFLRAVETEQKINAILMFFIVGVAGLVIACFLAMMVTEKKKDIGVLVSLGTTVQGIMVLFLFQGFFISVLGSLLGIAWGAAVSWNLNPIAAVIKDLTGYHPFPPDVYLLSQIPSNVNAENVSWIVVATVLCGSIFSVFPAWKAGRLDPVEALRYE